MESSDLPLISMTAKTSYLLTISNSDGTQTQALVGVRQVLKLSFGSVAVDISSFV